MRKSESKGKTISAKEKREMMKGEMKKGEKRRKDIIT